MANQFAVIVRGGASARYRKFVLLGSLLGPTVVYAQVPEQLPDAVTAAAATITSADVTRHLGVLTADSLRPRKIPSPGLESTAQYLAGEFQRLGLQPVVRDTAGRPAWIQRYPVPAQQQVDYARSRLDFMVGLKRMGKKVVDLE